VADGQEVAEEAGTKQNNNTDDNRAIIRGRAVILLEWRSEDNILGFYARLSLLND
jgi:hypothetical protein